MVNAFGRCAAVLAGVRVPREQRPAVQRRPPAIRDLHEVAEPNDRRQRNCEAFGPRHILRLVDAVSFLGQRQHEGSTLRYDTDGFVGDVQHQRAAHFAHISPLRQPDRRGCAVSEHYREAAGHCRHHSSHSMTSVGLSRGPWPPPYIVADRNSRYAESGIGKNGGRRHHPFAASRLSWRMAVGHRRG